jgi:hypothetical protein
MIAEAWNLNAVLFSGLKDGKVTLHLIGFVVDEDFNLFRGEGRVGSAQTAKGSHS